MIEELIENQIQVENYSNAEANWSAMGTEYDSSSFYAIKEFLDNSFSAAKDYELCTIQIRLTEFEKNQILVEIEDNAFGISDLNTLLSIGTLSKHKNGIHNQFGYGIKNALAFFQPKWRESDWLIQSKTKEHLQENIILQVDGPYYFPHENNVHHGRIGIQARELHNSKFLGNFKTTSGTYLKFTTSSKILSQLSPLTKQGKPISKISTISEKLSELIAQWYQPKIRKNQVRVEIGYKLLNSSEFVNLTVGHTDYPVYELLGSEEDSYRSENGGEVKVKVRWFSVDRHNTNFFVPGKMCGINCYVNGVLIDPFFWSDEIIGRKWSGPLSTLQCVVEVNAAKKDCPEVAVSKTRFRKTAQNFQSLKNFLIRTRPESKILNWSYRNSVESERDKINQFIRILSANPLTNVLPKKEYPIELPFGKLTGNDCRYDLVDIDEETNVVKILEFKKGEIVPAAIYQANTYYDLAKTQFEEEGYTVQKLTIVGETINENAQNILNTLIKQGKKLEFVSYPELGLPK